MTDQNIRTQSENVSEDKEAHSQTLQKGRFAQAYETAKSSTKAAVFALTLGLAGAAHAEDQSNAVVLANAEASNVQGPGLDSSLSASEIQAKIDALEAKGLDNLSDTEFDLLFTYQDQLVALEKSETAEQEATIENLDRNTLQGLNEIKDAVEG